MSARTILQNLKNYIIDGRLDKIRGIIEDVDINALLPVEPAKTTPLILASDWGQVEIVRFLLSQPSISIDEQDAEGYSALMRACSYSSDSEREKIIGLLISAGASVHLVNNNGKTAMMVAMECEVDGPCDFKNTTRMLINAGSDLSSTDEDGNTPLLLAAKSPSIDGHRVVELLLDGGSDIHHTDKDGNTALIASLGRQPFEYYSNIFQLNDELVDFLLREMYCDVDKTNNYSRTPLMVAASNPHIDRSIIELLIEFRCDVDATTKNGTTALMMACKNPGAKSNIISELIDADCDVNSTDDSGYTAIMFALNKTKVDKDVVRVLIDDGDADVNIATKQGETPLALAIKKKSTDKSVIKMLIDDGGADIDHVDVNDCTPIMHAVRCGRLEVVKLLLKRNADVSIRACKQALASPPDVRDNQTECLKEVAAFVIQRQWQQCYYNPLYRMCRKRLMEEGEEMERDIKRLRKEDDDSGSDDSDDGSDGSE